MTMPLYFPDANVGHQPVMPRETIEALAPSGRSTYIDLTVGGGGHCRALLDAAPEARVIALDRDPQAVSAASRALSVYGERARVLHASFGDVEQVLADLGVGLVDGVLADLGLSSVQLDDASRGMSFKSEGPLDMRMDPSRGETVAEVVERLSQDELANVIYRYGEERRSRRLARCIKQALKSGQLGSTAQLRRAIVRAVGPRRVGGIDPATRTFQALRIFVNDEIGQLQRALVAASRILRPGGMAVFISFHSLEDRAVKRAFLQRGLWQRISKKPETPRPEEIAANPRAKSAKLRAAWRLPESPAAAAVEEVDSD